jgi:hypothetical protein
LCGLESSVVAGLGEHGGEHVQQVGGGVDVPNPATFVGVAQKDLRDREADQFTVGEFWSMSSAGTGRDYVVIDQHIECGEEGVQVVGHTSILNTLHPRGDTDPLHMIFTASII